MKLALKIAYCLFVGLIVGCSQPKQDNDIDAQQASTDDKLEAESKTSSTPTSYLSSRIGVPDKSPFSLISQMVGIDIISVRYYSPSVDGREIWGNVVPYNEIWRTGANSATVLSITSDCKIMGKNLSAGTYSIYTKPEKEKWAIHINTNIETVGIDEYDPNKNVLSFDIEPEHIDGMYESLTFKFSSITYNSCFLNLVWEKVKIPLLIEFDNSEKIIESIENNLSDLGKELSEDELWDYYLEAAQYCQFSHSNFDKGLLWVNKAIDLSEKQNYLCFEVRSDLMAAQEDYESAIADLQTARKLLQDKGGTEEEIASSLKHIDLKIERISSIEKR